MAPRLHRFAALGLILDGEESLTSRKGPIQQATGGIPPTAVSRLHHMPSSSTKEDPQNPSSQKKSNAENRCQEPYHGIPRSPLGFTTELTGVVS